MINEKAEIQTLTNLENSHFSALYQISELLNSAELEETLVSDSLDLVINALNAERGLFALYENNNFQILAARNIEKENIKNLSEFSSGILAQVVEKKRPCLYHNVSGDPNVSQFSSLQTHKIKSIIGVPVLKEENIWGVILVDSSENRSAFTEKSLQFLGFFSNLFSLALDRVSELDLLRNENVILKNQLQSVREIPNMIGKSKVLQKVSDLVHRVAPTNATVLLLGESGTGKDLAAKAIHNLSDRSDKPFIAQFCGNIPETLLESELFGYKKGAFSGANTDKKGLFEVASGGTFFLDEIGDISLSIQTKLLRVIENQEIIRVGDTQVKKVDVRIIAATNRDLKKQVSEGKFRKDLFYRLNVFPVTLPPLRERRSDIVLLAQHFIKKYKGAKKTLLPSSLKKLENATWEGNVRQLENVIQRALILCDSREIRPEHIIIEDETEAFDGTLDQFTKKLLQQRLEEFGQNRTQTARSLGVSVRWIQIKLKEIPAIINK